MKDTEILSRQLAREKKARQDAEEIAETKTRVLYQANLELQELSREMELKEQKTKAILDASADGIVVLNTNFDITLCNQSACQLLGYDFHELIGKNINDLIDPASHDSFKNAISLVLEKTKKKLSLIELEALRRDHKTIAVEIAISTMPMNSESVLICALRDISERKHLGRLMATRHQIVQLLAEKNSLDDVMPQILKIICETMRISFGGLLRVDSVNHVLRYSTSWMKQENAAELIEFNKISKQFRFELGIGLPGRVWKSKTAAWIDDVLVDSNFPRRKWAINANLHSAFAFPIMLEGEVLAVIEFFYQKIHDFDKSTIIMLEDVTRLLGIFIDREYHQKRIIELSRSAGIAEVASNILHNVGNILNSINISIELLYENISNSKMKNIVPLTDLLQQHKNELDYFITEDPKGKNVMQFLSSLAEAWVKEKKNNIDELKFLKENLENVKKIIFMQQSLGRAMGITETISISELLETAVKLNKIAYKDANIQCIYDFQPVKQIKIDRMKLFQIVINLIKNAMESLIESKHEPKLLTIRTEDSNDEHFIVQIIDNGLGISAENSGKIFSQGYTTKKTGHGIGLHNSALYVKELGGKIAVQSEGIGKGCTFTLIFPYESGSKGDGSD